MKTVIFIAFGALIIFFALQYNAQRQKEFKEQSAACEQECKAQGHQGWEFKAGSFGQGTCGCL